MHVTLICCPFKTSFGAYGSALKFAIEAKTGSTVQWVASNCGCGDSMEAGRHFEATECDYFDMPMPNDFRSSTAWKRQVRGTARDLVVYFRARRYCSMVKEPDVVHFQQVLNAYGSKAVFAWLKRCTNAAKVVTVHELDSDQLEHPETNRTYNLADAILVHCDDMKQHMILLGVEAERIHIVLHGTKVSAPQENNRREDIVFYAGHKIMSGKGIETLFQAMAAVRERTPQNFPVLKIHGHYGSVTPAEALQLAERYRLTDNIRWLNQISEEEMVRLYQQSQLLILPYTGSFAGYAASTAAGCGLPIVCTRKAGLPDHLGDTAVWIEENNPPQLATRIAELLDDQSERREIGSRLVERAKKHLSWDVIAYRTLEVYKKAIGHRTETVAQPSESAAIA